MHNRMSLPGYGKGDVSFARANLIQAPPFFAWEGCLDFAKNNRRCLDKLPVSMRFLPRPGRSGAGSNLIWCKAHRGAFSSWVPSPPAGEPDGFLTRVFPS